MTNRTIIPPLLVLSMTGCTALLREPGFADVASIANARSGARVCWNQQTAADREVEKRVGELLSHPLDADRAVGIALLENPRLQARYELLGVAQADGAGD